MDSSWREVIAGAREGRDLLGQKVDFAIDLVGHVRAPLATKLPSQLFIWELNADDDLWVKLEEGRMFSAWINSDAKTKTLLESVDFETLLAAIVPLVGHEVNSDSLTQKGKTA